MKIAKIKSHPALAGSLAYLILTFPPPPAPSAA